MKKYLLLFAIALAGVSAVAQTITIDGKKSKIKIKKVKPDTSIHKIDSSIVPIFNEPLELPEKQPSQFTPEGAYTAPNGVIRLYIESAYRWRQIIQPEQIAEEIGRQIEDLQKIAAREGIRIELAVLNIRETKEPEYDMTNPNQILPSFASRMNIQYPPDKPRPFDFAYLWDLSAQNRSYGEMVYRNSISNPYGSFGIVCAYRHFLQSTPRFPNYDWSYMLSFHGFGHYLGLEHAFTCNNILPNGTVGSIDSSYQFSLTCNPPRKCRPNMIAMGYGDQCYGGSKNPKYGFGRIHGATARNNYKAWSLSAPPRSGLVTTKAAGLAVGNNGNTVSAIVQLPDQHNATNWELWETYNNQVNPTLILEGQIPSNGPQILTQNINRTRLGQYDYQVRLYSRDLIMSQSNLSSINLSAPPPPCTYTDYGPCRPNGTQRRTGSRPDCSDTVRACTYVPPVVVQDGVIGAVQHYSQNGLSFFRFGIPSTGNWLYEVAYCRYDGPMNPPDSVTPPAACGIRNALNFSRPSAIQLSNGLINLQAISQPAERNKWYRIRVRYRNGPTSPIMTKQSAWFWW